MPQLKIMNTKEIREMYAMLDKQYGFRQKLNYAFAINTKNRVYVLNKEIFGVKIDNIRLNSLGLYFAEINGEEIRLSIEGSQVIGNNATKNIVELSEKEALKLLKGEDLERESDCRGFVILKHGKDYLGTGKSNGTKILNFVSKARRIS